jgi:site-specific DNA-cytosine methylase
MISAAHMKKLESNEKLQRIINSNYSSKIYIDLNGNQNYQTIGKGLFPKIKGSSYKQIVEIDPNTEDRRYITNIELAEAQGYIINLPDINSTPFIVRIIGNSIPKLFIEAEINSYGIQYPSVGVIGGYGLEGLALSNCNFEFLTITNHTNNGYLSSDNIKSVLYNNNPPSYIYEPNNYHEGRVDIVIWKFPCQYGSNQSRNSNTKKQLKLKTEFEDELQNNYNSYIKKYSPTHIMIELPSNINHKSLGEKNLEKIGLLEKVLGKDYIREEYAFNTKKYGLNQNRRSYIVRFTLNLPKNIIRGYDSDIDSLYYYNTDTKEYIV